MTTDPLTRLEEALATATGPSKRLNATIWRLVNPIEYRTAMYSAAGLWPRGCDKGHEEQLWAPRAAPRFTTSIDAALALIEAKLPGMQFWRMAVGGVASEKPGRTYVEFTFAADGVSRPDNPHGWASTPALAMMLALVRALAAQGGEPEPVRVGGVG